MLECSKQFGACYRVVVVSDQFRSAGLSIFNNNWSNVHDFTPVAEHNNFRLYPAVGPPLYSMHLCPRVYCNSHYLLQDVKISEYVPAPTSDPLASVRVNFDPSASVVPRTYGRKSRESKEVSYVKWKSNKSAAVASVLKAQVS